MITTAITNQFKINMEKVILLRQLAYYVTHSNHVYSHSIYKKIQTLESLDECKRLIVKLQAYTDSFSICQEIYAKRYELIRILPDLRNASFCSSEQKLIEILNTCRAKLHLPGLKDLNQFLTQYQKR